MKELVIDKQDVGYSNNLYLINRTRKLIKELYMYNLTMECISFVL